ncbi:MAG: VWA domain-containing protein [Spirochaetaceae bacterium]|jgi:Ca-activated chloride channel family protein|nr:VWA domain-containing protein [Spirochaetaceae bacterium]
MSFGYPILLCALFALPAFALVFFVQYRRLFPLVRNMSLQKDRVIKARYFYSGLFGLLSFAALAVAAAGPSLTLKYQEERPDGADIVFAFDVSRSMNVRDVVYNEETISRLEAARFIADGVLAALEARRTDFRYAVAAGKGEGVLAIPLTYGVETVCAMLDSLSSSAISAAGTNVEKLMLAATSAFSSVLSASYPAEKRIILFTDGEALSGEFQHAAERARNEDITVAAVCLGSEKGGTIPVGVSDTGGTLYLRDKTGKPVVSRAESGALQEAVESTGGFFTGAEDIEAALAALNAHLDGALLPQEERETREVWKKKDISFLFAALALLFFTLHKAAFYTLAKTSPRKKTAVLPHILPLMLLLHSCAPAEAKIRLLEGNFFVARDMLDEAETSYTRARSLAAPGDIPYAIYALAFVQLRRDEKEAVVDREEAEDSAAIPLLGEAHTLIANENAADTDRITQAFRHRHGEQHRELAYRIHYNAGLAHYNAGKPEEAAWEFRQALLADPGRIEAKRNLEISLALLENKSGLQTSEVKTARPVREGTSRGNSVLFDFIRQKETNKWKSWAWQGEEGDSLQDY